MTKRFVTKCLAVAMLVGTMSAFSQPAVASDCYQPKCYYEAVTVFVKVRKPVVYYVTKTTDCGHQYRVRRVTYQWKKVPVTKYVKVCD